MTNKEVKKLIMKYIADHKPITSYVEHKAFLMIMESLEKMGHRCKNCNHRKNQDFDRYLCNKRWMWVYDDMYCSDWSDEE